ncbi:Putative sulfite oxidase [Durusdinium trenchii]|uniref:Mitochondrial n=1 Tax=Durusdinium trenchii TaxID=1381693 RepID=A0ABP0J8Y7_9DINO
MIHSPRLNPPFLHLASVGRSSLKKTGDWQRVSSQKLGTAPCLRRMVQHVLAGASCAGMLWRVIFFRRSPSSRQARTELLVDADSHSIEEVRQAIHCLEDQGRNVRTAVFAAPGRADKKTWAVFLRNPAVRFRGIQRTLDGSGEANDEAISLEMQKLSQRRDVGCIALLTSDSGFGKVLAVLKTRGIQFLVLVPEKKPLVIKAYKDRGLEVLTLASTSAATGSRVRAILHGDGTGSVTLADLHPGVFDEQQAERVRNFLTDLGYARPSFDTGRVYLPPACAKFWFTNALGSLTVFPPPVPVKEVMLQSLQTRSWRRYEHQLAFCLPTSPRSKLTKDWVKAYGNRQARAVYKGGGPFILPDSPNLTFQALKRLGYLDDKLNTDEFEAMLCFTNNSHNKIVLRQLHLLPDPADHTSDVKEKLRAAFLSDSCPCQWLCMPSWNSQSGKNVELLGILERAGALDGSAADSQEALFEVMQNYARQEDLPPMRSFNGLLWRIFRHEKKDGDPNLRSVLEFSR